MGFIPWSLVLFYDEFLNIEIGLFKNNYIYLLLKYSYMEDKEVFWFLKIPKTHPKEGYWKFPMGSGFQKPKVFKEMYE